MTDLVDYLRERLAHASEVTCCCPDIDVSGIEDLRRGERAYVRGYNDRCPIHGLDGTEPAYRRAAQ